MKKLLILCAFSAVSFVCANSKKDIVDVKQEVKREVKLSIEQQNVLLLMIKWWGVSFTNSCGQNVTVLFQSDNQDGSAGFIRELAFAVNDGYDNCVY